MVAILVLLTIITCLTVDYLSERAALRRAALAGMPDTIPIPQPVSVRAPEDLSVVPAGVFVGPGHSWLELEPAGAVRLGMDRLPVTLLGGVDGIETVPAGTEVGYGDRVAVLRHGNRSVELRSPVEGVVTDTNPMVLSEPDRLAREPFGSGWLLSLRPRELGSALRRLFVAEEARTFLREEIANLREYLVGLSMAGRGSLATATLPDGGLPVEGLASRMTEEEWEEIKERFF